MSEEDGIDFGDPPPRPLPVPAAGVTAVNTDTGKPRRWARFDPKCDPPPPTSDRLGCALWRAHKLILDLEQRLAAARDDARALAKQFDASQKARDEKAAAALGRRLLAAGFDEAGLVALLDRLARERGSEQQ